MRCHTARRPVSLQPSASQPSWTITPCLDLTKVTLSWCFAEGTWGDAGGERRQGRWQDGISGDIFSTAGLLTRTSHDSSPRDYESRSTVSRPTAMQMETMMKADADSC